MTNGEKFEDVFGFGADGSRVIAVNSTWWDCEYHKRSSEELSKPHWISVEERLPDYPGRFLCYYEVDDYGEIGHCIDWGRYDPDDGWYVSGVTHWASLPEPPKGEENGDK